MEASATPQPKVMIVCTTQEPGSLYTLAGDDSPGKRAVLAALYGWGIDSRSYVDQATGIKKVPRLQDGDAVLSEVEVKVGDAVYDSAKDELVQVAPDSRIVLRQKDGSLTRVDFSVSPTATTVQMAVTWSLSDGLTWEDGRPVTTDDILFAWQVASAADTPGDKSIFERTVSYAADDSQRWTWTGAPGYSSPTYFRDALVAPLPKHLYGEGGSRPLTPAEMMQDDQVNHHPLAFGAFKLVEWVRGDHIRLTRNPDYYHAAQGLPKLDGLLFRFIPTAKQLVAELAAGTCQLGTQDAKFEDELLPLRQFQAQDLLNVQQVSGNYLELLDFNARPADGYTGFANTARNADGTPVFADPEIRRGIAACLDRQGLIDQLLNGAALPQLDYVTDNHPLYAGSSNLTGYDFDPARGRSLLTAHGWTDSDGDGILDDGHGRKFSFVISARDTAFHHGLLGAIQGQFLKNCGIEATPAYYGVEYLNPGPQGVLFGRRYDVAESTLAIGAEPSCDLYLTQNIPAAGNWSLPNISGFSNPDFDKACGAALGASDQAEKAAQHANAQKIFTEFLPSLPLFARVKILVTRPEVQGVILDPTAASELWNVENFDLVIP